MKLQDIIKELREIRALKFSPSLHMSNKIHALEQRIVEHVYSSEEKLSLIDEKVMKKSVPEPKKGKSVLKQDAVEQTEPEQAESKMIKGPEPIYYTPNVSVGIVDSKN